nr:hypothetical protein [Tanacetum cinerariifolium]
MEALIEDGNAMDKGVTDTVKDHKRKHDDDDDEDDDDKDPPEPVEEPTAEVVMDDAGEDVVRNDDQPQDTFEPKTPWFNQLVSATKDPLTFNDLMATSIDLSNIELEYHFQEYFNALTDKLDWNNPEGDHYPFDLSKPLPLQGHPGHLTIVVDYFFNNDLEYLKSSKPERTYTTSIMKTKAARLTISPNVEVSFNHS